jgi:hypothetical protein
MKVKLIKYKYQPIGFAIYDYIYAENLFYAWKEVKRRHKFFHNVQNIFTIEEA